MNLEERVQWVYDSKSNAELVERYQKWASTYEQDMFQGFDYQSPRLLAEAFKKFVTTDAKILDVGSGTGLMGQTLSSLGYHNLVALDMSEEMLDIACEKGVYESLHIGILGQPLNFPSNTFDAVAGIGIFTLGHAPASSFDELVRVTKPSGLILFTLYSDLYDIGEFPEKFAALEASGAWSLQEVSDELQPLPVGEPEATVRVIVYEVN